MNAELLIQGALAVLDEIESECLDLGLTLEEVLQDLPQTADAELASCLEA